MAYAEWEFNRYQAWGYDSEDDGDSEYDLHHDDWESEDPHFWGRFAMGARWYGSKGTGLAKPELVQYDDLDAEYDEYILAVLISRMWDASFPVGMRWYLNRVYGPGFYGIERYDGDKDYYDGVLGFDETWDAEEYGSPPIML